MAGKTYTTMQALSAGVKEFDKQRKKMQIAAMRTVMRDAAKVSRKKARSVAAIKNAIKVNPYIKVMIVPSARYSNSQETIVGKIKATGIVAKVELGKAARRFRLVRMKGDPFSFKTKRGWVTVGDIKAGGQKYRARKILDLSAASAEKLSAAMSRAQVDAAFKVLGS